MKRWITVLVVLGLMTIGYYFMIYHNTINSLVYGTPSVKTPDYRPRIPIPDNLEVEQKVTEQCEEKQNFVFIKTHKTGTSTTVNILYYFGMTRGLNYAVYPYLHQLWAIDRGRLMKGVSFNIMCQHMIFNYNKVKSVIKAPDTYYFTLLRDPIRTFISFFVFYRYDNRLDIELGGDQSLDSTINEFLDQFTAMSYIDGKNVIMDMWDTGRYPIKNSINSMSYDIGMIGDSSSLRSITKLDIEYYIAKLDSEIDFVMVLEHLDESLILLAEDMCWSNEDLFYINRMQSSKSRSKEPLTDKTKERLRNYLQPDIMLYDHYKMKLLKRLKNKDQVFRDRVDKFKEDRAKLELSCMKTDEWVKGPYGSKSHPLTEYGLTNLHCAILVERDTTLTKILSLQQDPDEVRRKKSLGLLSRPANFYHDLGIARKDKLKP